MPIRAERTTINGTEYSVTTLGGVAGFRVLSKLPKYIGGAVGALIGGAEDPATVSRALSELGERMAEPEFLEIVFELLDGALAGPVTLVNGKIRTGFDEHFGGRYADLLPLIVHAFRSNFASFFVDNPAFAALMARAASGGAKARPSPPTSTGG